MTAWYNENDPFAADWLERLIQAGLIAPGIVDRRSIVDVRATDLAGFVQCHFFAGIGGWSAAFRLAGWRDDKPGWTGSCPCQPLSSAGQRKGHADERHLWPAFYALIAECRPTAIFGEQVESKDGREWLSGVRADLEGARYAVGAADLCASGVGAPIRRQRLYWVANASHTERRSIGLNRDDGCDWQDSGRQEAHSVPGTCSEVRSMAGAINSGYRGQSSVLDGPERTRGSEARSAHGNAATSTSPVGTMDGTYSARRLPTREWPEGEAWDETRLCGPQSRRGNGYWDAFDVLDCIDGKARRVEPGTFPLAHGVPSRVGRLRGYGNAIVPEVAAQFVGAFMECQP